MIIQGCSQGVFFTEAMAEFQHVSCMIVRICEVKGVACCIFKFGSCVHGGGGVDYNPGISVHPSRDRLSLAWQV